MAVDPKPPALFTPVRVGTSLLQHRIAFAPCTRFRADIDHVPTELMVEYYSQRASTQGTLLITGATPISAKAGGYDHIPGIYTDAQIKGWKKVVDAVHARGSFVFLQLWAIGRAANSRVLAKEALKDGLPADAYPVVSASDIPMPKNQHGDGAIPRPLTVSEINEYVESFADAAENAVEGAGFDGVEIHGANGYLIDQFLQTNSNKRTDEYGGSVENRARFGLRVVDAIASRIGQERTAIRISPWQTVQGMRMSDPIPTFRYFVQQLKTRHPKLAYLHGIEGKQPDDSLDFVRDIWSKDGQGVFLSAGDHSRESALRFAEEKGDVVAFGKWFISNPDLPRRLKEDLPLTQFDHTTFYTYLSPKGYIDYPFADRTP